MLSCGIRGTFLDITDTMEEVRAPDALEVDVDLETYGVDWDDLGERDMVRSHTRNNPVADSTASWIGRRGPPPHLNPVEVEAPDVDFDAESTVSILWQRVAHLHGDPLLRTQIWVESLLFLRSLDSTF